MSIAYTFTSPVKLPHANAWFQGRYRWAERACLALCRLSAERIAGLDWRDFTREEKLDWSRYAADGTRGVLAMRQTRNPPLPGFQRLLGVPSKPNTCPVCCQPTYSGGAWWPEAGRPRANLSWHSCCAVAFNVWKKPIEIAPWLARRQNDRCPETGDLLVLTLPGRTRATLSVEVDHRVPLWRVRREPHAWPDVLRFWGPDNLQALSPEGHRIKTAREAGERAALTREVA